MPYVAPPFWTKVHFGIYCWEWLGSLDKDGYGRTFRVGGAAYQADRLAWEMERGSVPSGMLVCHRCDNPTCVRPDHLFLGSHADNVADMDKKGRRVVHNRGIPACKRGHEFKAGSFYVARGGGRVCKACHFLRIALKRQQRKVAASNAQD